MDVDGRAQQAAQRSCEAGEVAHGLAVREDTANASCLSHGPSLGFSLGGRAGTDSRILDVVLDVHPTRSDDLERESPDVVDGVDGFEHGLERAFLVPVPVVREALTPVRDGRAIPLASQPGLNLSLEHGEDVAQRSAVEVAVLQPPDGRPGEGPRQPEGELHGDLQVDAAGVDGHVARDRELARVDPADEGPGLGHGGVVVTADSHDRVRLRSDLDCVIRCVQARGTEHVLVHRQLVAAHLRGSVGAVGRGRGLEEALDLVGVVGRLGLRARLELVGLVLLLAQRLLECEEHDEGHQGQENQCPGAECRNEDHVEHDPNDDAQHNQVTEGRDRLPELDAEVGVALGLVRRVARRGRGRRSSASGRGTARVVPTTGGRTGVRPASSTCHGGLRVEVELNSRVMLNL